MINIDLNAFADISIRGRVAYSLCCLNTLLTSSNIDPQEWNFLSEKLWSYTSIKYLDEWHMEFAEYIPSAVMHYEKYDEDDFEYVIIDVFNQLQNFYGKVSDDVKEMIDLIFYMGTIELYGKVQKKGKSFEYLEKIIKIMIRHQANLPNVSRFSKYEFDKGEGWGELISKDHVIC